MKTVISWYVDVGLAQRVKDAAKKREVSTSELLTNLVSHALEHESPREAALSPKPFSRWEEATLAAIDALEAQYGDLAPEHPGKGNRFFPIGEVSHAAGLYPSEAIRGLRQLERRKVVVSVFSHDIQKLQRGEPSVEVEHWGRPLLRSSNAGK